MMTASRITAEQQARSLGGTIHFTMSGMLATFTDWQSLQAFKCWITAAGSNYHILPTEKRLSCLYVHVPVTCWRWNSPSERK